jgi:hypothetical protein
VIKGGQGERAVVDRRCGETTGAPPQPRAVAGPVGRPAPEEDEEAAGNSNLYLKSEEMNTWHRQRGSQCRVVLVFS